MKRIFMIVVTALGGAVLFVFAVVVLTGSPLVSDTSATTWQQWTAFGGTIGLAIVGFLVQFFTTGEDQFEPKS